MGEHSKTDESVEEFTSDLAPFDPTAIYSVDPAHDEDVKDCLERDTQDGRGGAVVPKTNFKSYATE